MSRKQERAQAHDYRRWAKRRSTEYLMRLVEDRAALLFQEKIGLGRIYMPEKDRRQLKAAMRVLQDRGQNASSDISTP